MTEAIAVSAPTTSPRKHGLRLIPALDTDAKLIGLAQTLNGRLILTGAMLMVSWGAGAPLTAIVLAGLVAYWPHRRNILMPLSTFGVVLFAPTFSSGALPPLLWALTTVALFAFAAGVLVIGGRVGRRGPFRRPVISLIALVLLLAALGCLPGLPGYVRTIIWTSATILTGAKWFLAYALVNVTGRKPCPLNRHIAMLDPFWGSTTTPFGKGAAFIAKFEAKSADQLAITQLKALKLMLWAAFLRVMSITFAALLSKLSIPSLHEAITALAAEQAPGHFIAIASVLAQFILTLLSLAMMGHVIIATARFAGFLLPRNTYRPLEACSISEFWNCYYFYFKELLVDFFFIPTFTFLSGWPPRVRMLCATLCAAGLGNYLFHFTRDIDLIRTMGPAAALSGSLTYAFYCLLLSTGIGCSQLFVSSDGQRNRSMPPTVARASVLLFYCFVSIFDDEGRTLSLADQIHFLIYVTGLA